MNKFMFTGRTTADIELKVTQSGVSVVSFALAVRRKYKNENGNYEADFINFTAFRQVAELLSKHTHKGDTIAVEGECRQRKYEKDGRTYYTVDFIVNEIEFLAKNNKSPQPAQAPEAPETLEADAPHFEELDDDDDLPF